MGRVITGFSTSLDGFIAGEGDRIDEVFSWMSNGDTEYTAPDGRRVFKVSRASAEYLRVLFQSIGALVTGRRQFDLTKGWGGKHPLNVPVFVVSHCPAPKLEKDSGFTFVTEGVERAIAVAKEVAGDKNVAVDGASIVQQAIKAGLIDEIGIDLVPFLLGAGVRYFEHLSNVPIKLERIHIVEAPDVTHLRFQVVK
jgi:dihydrofolate reductase